jgi:hypothetical protein
MNDDEIPLSDGFSHRVENGVCTTCGAQIAPVKRPDLGPGLWREPHYRVYGMQYQGSN